MIVLAPAKLNLYLHITGKRDDGYHLLDSLVAFTEFGDNIELTVAQDISLEVYGEFAHHLDRAAPQDNIVMRAAHALKDYVKTNKGVQIRLQKRIPVGAGLGGGSSDAAAVLRALISLWDVRINPKDMAAIALSLGSDVPVCLYGNPANISGIGDQLKPVEITSTFYICLVNPGVVLPTATVYKKFDQPFSLPSAMQHHALDNRALLDVMAHTHNDLTGAAVAEAPVIAEVLAMMQSIPGSLCARMSGSGATCFGLFEDQDSAHRALACMQNKLPGLWGVVTGWRGYGETK